MTDLAARFGKALVIAPHADDEVLGCGALLAALSRAGLAPEVAIVSQGHPPDYPAGQVAALKAEAASAHAILGVAATHWLGLPAARLDTLPHADLNAAIGRLVAQVRPDTLLLPFPGDIHLDHQLVFRSGLVAARPAVTCACAFSDAAAVRFMSASTACRSASAAGRLSTMRASGTSRAPMASSGARA